jgi:MraZ protein
MFLGQYYHTLDSKGRMTIPARLRDLLTEGIYLTQGFDQNLRLLNEPSFNAMAEKISHMSETQPKTRLLKRLFFSNASQVELDSLGRVLIPQFLRTFARLENEAVIVGVGEAIEIWSPSVWQEQLSAIGDSDANAQQFSDLDLSF